MVSDEIKCDQIWSAVLLQYEKVGYPRGLFTGNNDKGLDTNQKLHRIILFYCGKTSHFWWFCKYMNVVDAHACTTQMPLQMHQNFD